NYQLNVTARLQPGLKIEMAKSRLPVVGQRLTAIQPSDAEGSREVQIQNPSRFSMSTSPVDEGPVTFIGTLLMGMAGAGVLIAAPDVAHMLVARRRAPRAAKAVRLPPRAPPPPGR